jgi:hypothetical protein
MSPVQPTKCVPAGPEAAVTVTSVPFSSPLAVPLFTVNPAIDPENDATTNAIAPKSTLQCVFIIIRFLVVLCYKDQHDAAGYDGIRLLLSLPQMGEFVRTFALAGERTFSHSERLAIRACGKRGCKKSLLRINESCPFS